MEALKRVGIVNRCDHLPAQLSGGQQPGVAIARAIAGKPPCFWRYEPTGNLDSHAGEAILALIRKYSARNHGCVITTIRRLLGCARTIVIRDGAIQ